MIEVLSVDGCPACEQIKASLAVNFFEDEYQVVQEGSVEYDAHEFREAAEQEGYPFVVIRSPDGVSRFAKVGNFRPDELRRLLSRIRTASWEDSNT